jgi:hypothetical protein
VLAVAAVAAVCAGCGGGSGKPRTLLETERTIVALALHGSDTAWLAGGTGSRCPISLWLRTPSGTTVLPLPHAVAISRVNDCGIFGSYGYAAVALAGTNVAWLMNKPGANAGAIIEGASSAAPRRTAVFVRVLTVGSIVPPVGAAAGGIAATSGGLRWGSAHVAYRPDIGACDFDLSRVGCQTRVDGGGVFSWSGGVSTRVPGLQPAAALASAGDLLAAATWPVGRWSHGEAPLGSVQVRDGRNRVVTTVPAPAEIDGLAVSPQLLAVGDGLTSTVSVYEVPSGRFLRRVSTGLETRIAAIGRSLVLWDPQHVTVVDPATGRQRVVVGFPAPPRSVTGFYWTVTAVAVDGSRLAWAQTTPGGLSVVKVVDHVDAEGTAK